MTRVAYLPGDGVGPEVLAVARDVLTAAGFDADWVEAPVGWDQWRRHGDALPANTLRAAHSADAVLFGAITSKGAPEAEAELDPSLQGQGLRYRSPILRLRRDLALHTNVRPVRAWPGNPHAVRPDVDLVVFRENTEGLYAGLELHPFPSSVREAWATADPGSVVPDAGDDTAVALRVVTRRATRRLIEAAFRYALEHGRSKVTLVEKANVLRMTGGLVRQVFHEVAGEHPEIATHEMHIDAACARLVREPATFDVVVATNLLGDILSDVAAEVAGGLALAPSGNLGEDHALFEPVHGSAPDVAGTGRANPIGAVLAGAMLARHVGQEDVASRVEAAVASLLAEGSTRTPDLGGSATTSQVADALIQRLSAVAANP